VLAIQVGFAVVGTAIAAAITHTRVAADEAPVRPHRTVVAPRVDAVLKDDALLAVRRKASFLRTLRTHGRDSPGLRRSTTEANVDPTSARDPPDGLRSGW
jgi:hypothetical protein